MDFAALDAIAQKAVRKLNGRIPLGTSREDAYQDAVVSTLRWADVEPPAGVPREAFLVMKTWGDLKDKYAREYARNSAVEAERGAQCNRQGRWKHTESPEDPYLQLNPRKPEPTATPDADTVIDVQTAITRLGEPGATVIRMEMEGRSHTEIGAAFGYSRSWASRTLARAREQLKTLLESYRDA